VARFGHRHGRWATVVGKLSPQANLYRAPPARQPGQTGRPRLKGDKLPSPQQWLAQTEPSEVTVAWYGGARRRVALVSGTGHWYRSGQGLVPLRWVQVRDLEGTHRQECFFSTDLSLRPSQIVSAYTARWAIEVTFHQARAHLGLATPRNRTPTSVLRTTPCLFGLFSVVALMFAQLYRKHPTPARAVPGYAKPEPTFVDALAAVRRELWSGFLKPPAIPQPWQNPPPPIIDTLLDCFCYAA